MGESRLKSVREFQFIGCCKYQRGQALPLGLAFLMGAVLFAIVMFNTSQHAIEKTRLANTADAAVYSGLVWQARALNYQAYTNRAMVANQVSIGQLVSLTSWTKYGSILGRNIDSTLGLFPPAKAFTSALKEFMDGMDEVVVGVAEVFIPMIDMVSSGLSSSQQALYLATFAATPAIVQEVVKKNDRRFDVDSSYAVVGMGKNVASWGQFSEQYSDNDGLLRKKEGVVDRSLDEFTKSRGIKHSQLLPGTDPIDTPIFKAEIRKEGSTRLEVKEDSSGNLEWQWKGKDGFSLHTERRRFWGWSRREIPVGWGSRYITTEDEDEDEDEDNGDEGYLNKNKSAEGLADLEVEELDADYNGIQAYYDLKDLTEENQSPRIVLRIEVQMSENDMKTSSNIDGLGSSSEPGVLRTGIGGGMFSVKDNAIADSLASIASGEVYFHPPDDYLPSKRQGKIEVANLFSPYWEVRLINTPVIERMTAWTLRDPNILLDGASGLAQGVVGLVEGGLLDSIGDGVGSSVSVENYQSQLNSYAQNQGAHATNFENTFVDGMASEITELNESGIVSETTLAVGSAASGAVNSAAENSNAGSEVEAIFVASNVVSNAISAAVSAASHVLSGTLSDAVAEAVSSILEGSTSEATSLALNKLSAQVDAELRNQVPEDITEEDYSIRLNQVSAEIRNIVLNAVANARTGVETIVDESLSGIVYPEEGVH